MTNITNIFIEYHIRIKTFNNVCDFQSKPDLSLSIDLYHDELFLLGTWMFCLRFTRVPWSQCLVSVPGLSAWSQCPSTSPSHCLPRPNHGILDQKSIYLITECTIIKYILYINNIYNRYNYMNKYIYIYILF